MSSIHFGMLQARNDAPPKSDVIPCHVCFIEMSSKMATTHKDTKRGSHVGSLQATATVQLYQATTTSLGNRGCRKDWMAMLKIAPFGSHPVSRRNTDLLECQGFCILPSLSRRFVKIPFPGSERWNEMPQFRELEPIENGSCC